MSDIAVEVRDVWKKFHRGEIHDSLRDLIPALVKRALGRGARASELETGDFWALREIDLQVRQGEVLGIIGGNGAGKSTLLKILARVLKPSLGYVRVRGRLRALIEISAGFHGDLTGRENIYLNGTILGMKRREIEAKFDQIVEFSGIEPFLDTPLKRYSSGMQARLGFAVAAHLDPEILIVDEVLAVGDVAFQKKCLGKMNDVAHDGRTVLFVSHSIPAVQSLCTRAILLSGGRIRHEGSVPDVVTTYLAEQMPYRAAEQGVLARSPDGSLEVLSIRPADGKGEPCGGLMVGSDGALHVAVRCHRPRPSLIASIGLNNLYGTRVAVLHSEIAGFGLNLPDGEHVIACRIPRVPLLPGRYKLDLKLAERHEAVLAAPGIAEVTVVAGDYYGTGRVLPNADWAGFVNLSQSWSVVSEEAGPREDAAARGSERTCHEFCRPQ